MGYPGVGDIVVFNSPENMDQLLVKRITRIKKENDTLHIRRDNYLFLRKLIAEEGNDVRMRNRAVYINGICDSIYRLKRTYYYVEGDNSADSRDSRYFGYIPETLIVGKFNCVLFSVNNLGTKGKKIRFRRFFHKIT
ncbi:signal peptidase I [Parabacteroides segnis]|jgi:signal peptidase I|uniref:signal peptidase I n=1 Tax=Parabacteroides TaxID=375288 RepID=UPI0025489038|nr:signal peptidase I [Parabacteroides sp. TA-V-105]